MDSFWQLVIDDKKRYFEKYLDLILDTTKTENDTLTAKTEEVRRIVKEKGLDPDEGEEHLAELAYEVGEMEQLMYRSFVLSVFISMEDLITRLCNHVQRESKQSFSVRDLGGSGISRSIRYLETVLEKSFPADAGLCSRFEVAWKVRNALAHAGGDIEGGNKIIVETFISENPGLLRVNSISSNRGEIWVSAEYAASMVVLNEEICDEVSKNWKTKRDF